MPLASIEPSPLNPRTRFDQLELDELATSLKTDGLLEPIVVKKVVATGSGIRGGDRYQIVFGERRYRAAKQLGWTDIPAIIRNVDDATHVRLALLENLQRSDLDPLDEARGYQQLLDLGMTQEQVADAVHRSRPAIANGLRLLKAPEAVQTKLRDGRLQPSHVLALLRYEAFPEALVKLAEVAAEHRTPSKQLEAGLDGSESWKFTQALTDAKLAVSVGVGSQFDWETVCTRCPFGAFQKIGYGGYCLRPDHYRELQKEARAKQKAEVQAAAEQASADGTTVLTLRSLKYGQYERLDYGNVPKACTPKCECRAIAMDGARQVKICTKPTRLRQLRQEQRRGEERSRAALQKDLSERCDTALVQVDRIRGRELALMAADALGALNDQVHKALLAKHGVKLKSTRRDAIDFESLSHVDPLVLVKLAAEAILSQDITRLQYHSQAPYASWYAGPRPKPEKPKRGKKPAAAAPTFDPDARIADEIAAEAERLAAEFELAGAVQ